MHPVSANRSLCFVLAASLALGGCLFGDNVSVTTEITEETSELKRINIDANGTFLSCTPTETNTFRCIFLSPTGTDSLFGVSLSSVDLLLFLFLVDPLVIQLPDTISNVHGSFDHPAATGALAVNGPLSSVAIDRNRNLTAEPGTRLYVLAFPESVHADVATINGVVRNPNPADVSFNLQFDAPVGVTAIPAKVIAAAHARTLSGEDFYLPVFPCVSSMAAVPALTVPLPTPGNSGVIDLSIAASVSGCNGEIFDIAGTPSLPFPTEIPVLGPWGLVSLVAILGTLIGWYQRRRS